MILVLSILPAPATIAFIMPGGYEWIILLVLGLLIFGRRLPEVGRSLGKGIVEFKKGIKGIEDEINVESSQPAPRLPEDASPRLSEPRPPAATETAPPAQSEATVGGESPNPYVPQEQPPKQG